MKLWTTSLALAASLLLCAQAGAETPYSPKKLSPGQVLQPANYERVPIKFNQWEVESTRSVVNRSRLDFEQTYDVAFFDMVDFFEKAFHSREPVSVLDPEVFPHANAPELTVYGKHTRGEIRNFTLGSRQLPYRFTIEIRPDERGKAIVTIQNAIFSVVYGGTMPARAPFKPAGKANPVPFRWN